MSKMNPSSIATTAGKKEATPNQASDTFDPRTSLVPAEALIVVRAEGKGPPFEIRLRRVLKAMLRAYGLRCTAVSSRPAAPGSTQGVPSDASEGQTGPNEGK
jgi:hypothetical protein